MSVKTPNNLSEKPPVFSSWKGWYILLLVMLLIQLIFYFFLTRVFA